MKRITTLEIALAIVKMNKAKKKALRDSGIDGNPLFFVLDKSKKSSTVYNETVGEYLKIAKQYKDQQARPSVRVV